MRSTYHGCSTDLPGCISTKYARCVSKECGSYCQVACKSCFDILFMQEHGHEVRKMTARLRDQPKPLPETFLVCDIGASASVQIPPRREALPGTWGAYSATLEVLLPKLPPRGQFTSLLRLGALWLHVNDSGAVLSSSLSVDEGLHGASPPPALPPRQAPAGAAPSAGPEGRRLVPGRWHSVAVTVREGHARTYVNGAPCSSAGPTALGGLPALNLADRIHLFGGVPQTHCRGGSVRRLTLHDTELAPDSIFKSGLSAWGAVPTTLRAIIKAQAVHRGRATRAALRATSPRSDA